MKVLLVLRQIPTDPSFDGESRWLQNVIKTMKKMVNQLDILGQHVSNNNKSFILEHCSNFISIPYEAVKHPSYEWILNWDPSKIDNYNPHLAQLIKCWSYKINYDLAICFGHGAHVYLPYIKARHKMMVPLDAPSGMVQSLSDSKVNSKSANFIGKIRKEINRIMLMLSQKSYNYADSILVVSKKDHDILKSSGIKRPILICPLGIDLDEFTSNPIQPRDNAILFTGVLDFLPNSDAIIHLVNDIFLPSQLNSEGIVCRIAGRRPTAAIQDLTAFPGVELYSNLPDLKTIFDKSMIFVAPMRIGLGMKTKVLEAMAMAMPIVGYPLAFNGISNPKEFAMLCATPKEIINAIRKLIVNPQLRQQMGIQAREYVHCHHSSDTVAKFITNYIIKQ